ncbi:MAG: ATP-dependent RecD-like DNA helicase [Candidatus Berkiellales bacterium]
MSTEHLKGSVERVTFHSEESGFCVLRVKVEGRRELETIVGNAPSILPGEFIECSGHWLNDKQHGLQFKAEQLKTITPTSLEGIQKYLGSGLIKGIGPGYAERLIRAFKEKVFTIIEHTPQRLSEVEGIGTKRRQLIISAWAEQRMVRDIMVFLHSYGVGTARAVRIYKTYGDQAIKKITENPYILAQEVHGIGFKTADQLAQRMGIAKDSILRVRAGVVHCLQEYTTNGHCGIEKEALITQAITQLDVSDLLVAAAIEDQIKAEYITQISVNDTPICFLTSLYLAEKGIAEQCQRLLHGVTTAWANINCLNAITWVQNITKLMLSPSQQQAVTLAIKSKVVIITGGPGVGKTTIVNSILQIIAAKKVRILLTAPTGRAAKRLSETTGLEAKTIHRLLEFDPKSYQFKRNQNSPLPVDLLIVDETSMVDVPLMNQLLRAIPDHAALILVGDVDQLPSVGPGMVLKDMIDSNVIPTVTLTEIFRQAATSKIITNAHRIHEGKIPIGGNKEDLSLSDFYIIPCEDVEKIKELVISLVAKRIPAKFKFNPINDIQVLTPTRRGGLGTTSLNIELQKYLNPQHEVINKYGNIYGIGDKVIQIINNYDKEVFNGDIGTIAKLDFEENLLWINFDDRLVEYDFSDLDEINLAYATTIHKSQGSEYPVVVIPLALQHYTLLERNLLYTGVTRGKKLVILVGQMKAIAMATKRLQAHKRVTYLNKLLNQQP